MENLMTLKKALAITITAALTVAGLTGIAAHAAANQQPELYSVNVGDSPAAADARHFLTHQGVTYFTSYSLVYGRSIWSMTQAEPEPVHVVDASPGTWTGSPGNLFAFGNHLFFTADPTFENDGFRPFMFNLATRVLTEIKVDSTTSFTSGSNFVEVDGDVYFVDDTHAIWKIDTVRGFASIAKQLSFPVLQSNFIRKMDGATNPKLLSIGNKILLIEDVLGTTWDDPNRFKDKLWVYDPVGDTLTDTGLIGAKLFGNYQYDGSMVAVVTDATNFQQFFYNTARGYIVGTNGVPVPLGDWSVTSEPRGFVNFNGSLLMIDYGSGSAFNFWRIEPNGGARTNLTASISPDHPINEPESVLQVGSKLVFAADVNASGSTLHAWNGTDPASRVGTIRGINPRNDIFTWTLTHSSSRNNSAHAFGDELLMNLYLDESIGYEPYLVDLSSGETTLVADLNLGTDGSSPDTSCFATLDNFDYMTAGLPLQSSEGSTDVLLELKGDEGLLKYSVIDLDGISGACGFSVGADGLYFTAHDDDSAGIFRMNLDRTFDKLIEIGDNGDFGYLHDDKFYWTQDNDDDFDLYVYDLNESNPALAITQLTGEDQNRTQITFGGVQIEEDSVQELYGIGSNLFFTGESNNGDNFIYRVKLDQTPLVFEKINVSINTNANHLSPQELAVINGKLFFFDHPTRDRRAIFSFDPLTNTLDLVIDPATIEGNESFEGWDNAKPFMVGDVVYGVFYNAYINGNQLYRTTSTGVELVAMPENFVFECAAPAGDDLVISDNQGVAYFYGDPLNPRLLPLSFASNTYALCDSVSSEQGTYVSISEYPYSDGYWGNEPGFIGSLAPVAVERLGQPVTETPAIPFSNDPSAFALEAPGIPGTPIASQVDGGIKVVWTAPTTGDTPTSYIITSSPAGANCTMTGLEATCTGLTDATPYTFSVRAINGGGSSPIAGPSNSITYSETAVVTEEFSPPQTNPTDPNLPVVTPARFGHNAGGDLQIEGSKLDQVTRAFIAGQEVKVTFDNGKIKITIPEGLTPGTYSLRLDGGFGSLVLQDYLTILGSTTVTGNQDEMRTWTSINTAKDKVRVIYKNPVGVGKVQFRLNGKELAWARATDATDPKLRSFEVNGIEVPYLVRTVELTKGIKNAFEIYVDGVRVWRAAYFGK